MEEISLHPWFEQNIERTSLDHWRSFQERSNLLARLDRISSSISSICSIRVHDRSTKWSLIEAKSTRAWRFAQDTTSTLDDSNRLAASVATLGPQRSSDRWSPLELNHSKHLWSSSMSPTFVLLFNLLEEIFLQSEFGLSDECLTLFEIFVQLQRIVIAQDLQLIHTTEKPITEFNI